MYKILITIFVLSLFVSVFQCSDDQSLNIINPPVPDIVTTDSIVTLQVGQSAIILPDSLNITFLQLGSESRCPINAYCFWEGMADIVLKIHKPGSDTIFTSAGITGSGDGSQLAAIGHGYQIKLTELMPYPQDFGSPPNPLEYRAILRITDTANAIGEIDEIIIADIDPQYIFIDPYELYQIAIRSDTLDIGIQYSGGCRKHIFQLFMSPPAFLESNPVQAKLYLRHFDNGDVCLAYITETRSYDLSEMAELYRTYYGSPGDIRINVYEYYTDEPVQVLNLIYHVE